MNLDPLALAVTLAFVAGAWALDGWAVYRHCRWCGDYQPAGHSITRHRYCPACEELQARAARMHPTAPAHLAALRDRLVGQGFCGARLRDELATALPALGGIDPLAIYRVEAGEVPHSRSN